MEYLNWNREINKVALEQIEVRNKNVHRDFFCERAVEKGLTLPQKRKRSYISHFNCSMRDFPRFFALNSASMLPCKVANTACTDAC